MSLAERDSLIARWCGLTELDRLSKSWHRAAARRAVANAILGMLRRMGGR